MGGTDPLATTGRRWLAMPATALPSSAEASGSISDLHNPFTIGAEFYTYLGLPDNNGRATQAVLQNAFSIWHSAAPYG